MTIQDRALAIIENIDWNMLKGQKTRLIEIQSRQVSGDEDWEALEGIINLLDTVQDFAVDSLGIDEDVVFNLTAE